MAKLCVQMCPVLTKGAIENLGQHKIFTVLDVLKEDPAKLTANSKLQFKDILNLRQTLIAKYAPFPRQGLDAYTELLSDCAFLPTGIKSVDKLLNGGLLTGNIYEICGLSGSGKTQFCISVAINIARHLNKSVQYIDTKMDFSGKLAYNMLESRKVERKEIGTILEKIIVTRNLNYSDLYSTLCSIKNKLMLEPGSIRSIIIDSLPAIFFQYMGNCKMDSLGLMCHLVGLMRYISQEQHVAFLVVNLTSQWLDDDSSSFSDCENDSQSKLPCLETKVTLGKYWAHIPSTRFHILKSGSKVERVITVLKSSHLSLGDSCNVEISDEGVL